MSASSASASPDTQAELTRRTLFAYSLPGLVTAIPTIPVFTLLPVFYAWDVGIGLGVTGLMLFLSRGFDVITDPLIGRLTDHFGPAGMRALLLVGAVIAAPALVMLLSPPENAGATWLFVWSTLLYLGWTLVQVPYLTWGARLSSDYHERTRLTSGRETAVVIGILLSGSLPAVLGFLSFDEAERLSLLGWIAVLVGVPAFTLLARNVPLPRAIATAHGSWRGITGNRLFLRLLLAWFLNGLANGIPAVLFPLYCAHVLDVSDQTRNLLLAVYFTSAVIGIPFWLYLSHRYGKHRSWSLAMTVTCPAFAVAAMLGPGDAGIFAVVCLATGLCLGADLALPPAIQADVADWDRLRFHRNRTAGLFSLWNMASKLALAVAAGVILPLAGQLGLEEGNAPADSLRNLAMIYALLPCVFKIMAIAMVRRLPLTRERHAAIVTRLQRRDARSTGS